MLEIFLIVSLSKKIGKIVEDKGYKKGWYVATFVISWIVMEIAGAILGAIIFQNAPIALYVTALLGAGSAFLINYLFAQSLTDKNPLDPRGEFQNTNDSNPWIIKNSKDSWD